MLLVRKSMHFIQDRVADKLLIGAILEGGVLAVKRKLDHASFLSDGPNDLYSSALSSHPTSAVLRRNDEC